MGSAALRDLRAGVATSEGHRGQHVTSQHQARLLPQALHRSSGTTVTWAGAFWTNPLSTT